MLRRGASNAVESVCRLLPFWCNRNDIWRIECFDPIESNARVGLDEDHVGIDALIALGQPILERIEERIVAVQSCIIYYNQIGTIFKA